MNHMSLLIKPASGLCNMSCKYCFYDDVTNHRQKKNYGFMSDETVGSIILKAKKYAGNGHVTFSFQGGEPTLVGLDYYYYFVSEVNRHFNRRKIAFSIQTNGLNINEDWAEFFRKHDFLVGISLDGKKDIHDYYRLDKNDKPTFSKITKGIDVLNKYHVQYNILTVMTKQVARQMNSIYKLYKKNGFSHIQFLPFIDGFDSESRGVSTKDYALGLKKLFDLWYQDLLNGDIADVRYFNNLLMMENGLKAESCELSSQCNIQHVIESDGSIYPCDFYVLDEHCLGNINDIYFDELDKDRVTGFTMKTENIECRDCEWFYLCKNGCKRFRKKGKYIYCESMKLFFPHIKDRLKVLADRIG